MTTLKLESCRNKFNKNPWLAKLEVQDSEIKYNFVKYDNFEKVSGTRNSYEWELEEGIVYAKGDIENYSNYTISNFVIDGGKEITFTKGEVKKIFKAGGYAEYKKTLIDSEAA